MRCTSCGINVSHEARFCQKCGAKVVTDLPTNKAGDPTGNAGPSVGADEAVEEKLWSGGYSGKAMIGSWLLAGVISVGLIAGCLLMPPGAPAFLGAMVLIWLSLLVIVVFRKMSIHYERTSQRFIHQSGILTRTSDRIEMIDIEDVEFTQKVVERIFNVGSVRLSSSNQTHPVLHLKGIDNVKRIADLIDDARRKERRKRGLHIESI